MKKRIVKPFDVDLAKSGELVETRQGDCVRILCYDHKGVYPIVAAIGKDEVLATYLTDGKSLCIDEKRDNDLVIVKYVDEPDWTEQLVTEYTYDKNCNLSCYDVCYDEVTYPATPFLAKRQYAEAKISHILLNDPKYGGMITTDEWCDSNTVKYIIYNCANSVQTDYSYINVDLLAFHTERQRDAFLNDYPELVNDYLMIQ